MVYSAIIVRCLHQIRLEGKLGVYQHNFQILGELTTENELSCIARVSADVYEKMNEFLADSNIHLRKPIQGLTYKRMVDSWKVIEFMVPVIMLCCKQGLALCGY